MSLVELCHCGHHRDTHHFDVKGPADCLGQGCNTGPGTECKAYRDATKPDPQVKQPRYPDHASHCQCSDCKAWRRWGLMYPTQAHDIEMKAAESWLNASIGG